MIQFLEILLIAIAQGVGEFLPISSSGHNAVVDHLFERFGEPLTGNDADFIKLNVFLHLGTLLAVLIVFRQRIVNMFGKDLRLIPMLVFATIPAVAVGLPIDKFFPWLETNLFIISGCFILTGTLLLASLRNKEGDKTCSTMTWTNALLIGCSQAVAILPGLSRSGTTIVAGLFCKLKREEAAAFSFLLSIPVIAGSGILKLKDLLEADVTESGSIPNWLLAVGVITSAVVGILALVWLLDWLKKGKLWYFALWVFLMAPITLGLGLTWQPQTKEKSQAANEAPITEPVIASVPVSPLDELQESGETGGLNLRLLDEADEKERDRIEAEEQAKEQALIDEDQQRLPLVDLPENLVPLDPKDRIWVTRDNKSVVMLGRIALREGLLELFACRVASKEHESIVSVRVKPHLIHAALLAVDAKPGKPVEITPEFFVPPSGEEIQIKVRWNDETGKTKESLAQDWVWDASVSKEDAKKPMSTHWVFTGSTMYRDDEGMNHYAADESGELFGLSNFAGSILDVPIKSSADNERLLFACYTERIPSVGTPVTIVLTPLKN